MDRRGLPLRLLLVLVVLSGSVGCDRATKVLAESALKDAGRISMLHDVFRLEYVRNTGAFLSLGARLAEPLRSAFFVWGVGAIVLAMVALAVLRRRPHSQVVAFSLVAGGGLGNLWDRVAAGSVADFMNLGIGPLRTGIFNVADLAIVAGVALLLLRPSRRAPAPAGPGAQPSPPGGPPPPPPP